MESYKITTFVNGPKLKLQTRKSKKFMDRRRYVQLSFFNIW